MRRTALTLCALALAGCTATPPPQAPPPTRNPLYITPPPIQPAPSPRPSPSTTRTPRRVPSPRPSYPVRAIHAGEGCHGFDKGQYAYDPAGNLLWCGPTDAALPTWHQVN